MKLKLIFAFFLFSILLSSASAQSKKDIKKNKIKTITEFVSSTENGKEINRKVSYTVLNKNGKIIEETQYNIDGSIKKRETTKYDNSNNKIEETSFIQKGNKIKKPEPENKANINIKKSYKYNANNDKTEEDDTDILTGKLIEKQIISYTRRGEKEMEENYDSENKLVKKTTYAYNNKGLKVEKKTYKGIDLLEETKRYVYEY